MPQRQNGVDWSNDCFRGTFRVERYRAIYESFTWISFFDVGVDIFPLDYIPRDSETYDIQNKLISYGNYIAANWKLLEEEKTLSNYIRRFGDLCGIFWSISKSVGGV